MELIIKGVQSPFGGISLMVFSVHRGEGISLKLFRAHMGIYHGRYSGFIGGISLNVRGIS